MRHDWEAREPKTEIEPPCRRCRNCEVEQHRYNRYDRMRIVGYRWLPLVGLCKGITNLTEDTFAVDCLLCYILAFAELLREVVM